MSWNGDIYEYEPYDIKDIINYGRTESALDWEDRCCERMDLAMACKALHLSKNYLMTDIDCNAVANWLNLFEKGNPNNPRQSRQDGSVSNHCQ